MTEGQKQTTEGITFRVPSGSLHQLREESKKKRISLNTLVNQIFQEHLEWHTHAAQAKLHHVPRSSLSRIIDKLTEEELSEVAVSMAKIDFVDVGLLLRGEFTISSFVNIVENWCKISAFPYKHEVNDDMHNFIVQHDMGRKYSFLIKELYRYIVEEMFERKTHFIITDNTVVLRFKEGK
jgi:hypothetical protein